MIQEKLDDIQSLATRYIKTIAMDLIVVLVAFAYIFYQMITLHTTDLNPFVLLAQAAIGIICGIVIKQSLGENGFSRGYNSKFWIEEEDKYNDACNTALPYVDRVDNFYLYEEIDKKKNYRRQHLQEIRLKYDMWFDKEGNYIGTKEMFDKLEHKQKRVLNKCIKIKIYPLNLFSQYTISTEQDTRQETTDSKQRGKNILKNTISATLVAIIGVYFIPQLNGWNWASFISATMQVALWVMFGILQLYTNYNFVVQDKVAILRRKKETIQRFIKGCEENLYLKSPYDIEEKNETLLKQIQNTTIMVATMK